MRNLAYYNSGWRGSTFLRCEQFWVTANGNFLDHCVLEWCKLFGDSRGKHCWQKVVTEKRTFFTDLLRTLNLTEVEFEGYIKEMRTYRDKFVSHLDLDETMHIPRLRVARTSVAYLHDYLLVHENDGAFFPESPPKAERFYSLCAQEGKTVYTE